MRNRNIEQNRRIQEAIIQKQFNEAAIGVKSKSLFEKTDFVITDQREYNFNVDEIAAETYTQSIAGYSAIYTQH